MNTVGIGVTVTFEVAEGLVQLFRVYVTEMAVVLDGLAMMV
jgi:hypothetical protein